MLQGKNNTVLLTLILIAAASIRIAYLIDNWNSPGLTIPIIDSEYYHQWAAAMARGAGEMDVFFMSPFYPYVLSLLYRIFGVYTQVAALFQALAGVALVGMIYLLGRRLFNPGAGLLAACLAAFYRPFIYYEGVLLSAVLILLLNAGALFLLLSPRRKNWKDLAAGFLLGLSAVTRPNVLLFVAILTVVMLVRPAWGGWKKSAYLLLGVFLVLAPTAQRNHRLCGEWVLTTAGFGMNFFAGNNQDSKGIYWEAPFITSAEPKFENLDYRREASRLVGKELSITGASRFWARQGFLYITHHPLDYLELLSRKLFLFFHSTEIPNNFSIYAAQNESQWLRIIPLTFGLLAPIGFAFWLLRVRHSGMAVADVYGLSYLLATLIFFAASEYRLPLLLILLPMTAAGIQSFWQWVKSKKTASSLQIAALALLIAVPLNMPTRFTRELQQPYMDYFNLGSVLQKQGRIPESVTMLQRAIVLKPDFAEGHRLLGDSYHLLGIREPAAEEFRRAGADPDRELSIRDAERTFDQAQLMTQDGKYRQALELYLQGLSMYPEPPGFVYFNIAYLSLMTGDTLQAEHYIKETVDADPQEARAPFLSGLIAENRGLWTQAAESFKLALGIKPSFDLARAHAALACLRLGNISEAGRLIEPLLGTDIEDPALEAVVEVVAAEVGF
jgi:tetratricopeptide (TPR) repeat protein